MCLKHIFTVAAFCRCREICFCDISCAIMSSDSKLTDEERAEIKEQFSQVSFVQLSCVHSFLEAGRGVAIDYLSPNLGHGLT